MHFLYISLTGNTTNFLNRLTDCLERKHNIKVDKTNVKDLKGETYPINDDFICFVPTYLEGGNGVDNGYMEILTTPLRDFIASHGNDKYLVGIIGSGNKNFNMQYCLTAKQYSEQFNKPVLDDFELRGTEEDVKRIAEKIVLQMNLEEEVE